MASPAGDWSTLLGDGRTAGLRGVPGAIFLCLAHISAALAQSVPALPPDLVPTNKQINQIVFKINNVAYTTVTIDLFLFEFSPSGLLQA